jgi:acetyl esterase
MSKMPEHIRKAIREWGPGAGPDLNANTKKIYLPLLAPAAGVAQEIDLAYGEHPRQKLDVYHAADGKADKTIVVYIPGGGFTGGDKRQDDNYFGNVGRFFARQGMVGVTANYRLAPEFRWPSAARDVQAAVRWIKANAARFGADPARVFIFGHSAGSRLTPRVSAPIPRASSSSAIPRGPRMSQATSSTPTCAVARR